LREVLDRYLGAVFKHDPEAAPLAANHRATQNAVESPPGQGIWMVATGYGEVARRYFDPVSRQAMYFGILQEGAERSIASLRIKLNEIGEIAEAEWTIARQSYGGLFSLQGLIENPPPDRVLPLGDRVPREQMLATAHAYFDGIEKHDGSAVPKICGCDRVENGFTVTNRTLQLPPLETMSSAVSGHEAPHAAQELHAGDCTSGFELFATMIAKASPRRASFIDEEQGLLVMMTILQRPPGSTLKRNLLTEYFFMTQGKIDHITTAMYYLEHSAPNDPGWPT
jgi:hypothetical protein